MRKPPERAESMGRKTFLRNYTRHARHEDMLGMEVHALFVLAFGRLRQNQAF